MKYSFLLPLFVFFAAAPAAAQDFVNGSFEKNTGICQINITNAEFNAAVRNTKAFGSFKKPDIASSDCGFGTAQEGNWFVGIAANVNGSGKSEAISLELSSPLTEGNQYVLNFFTRTRYNAPNLEIALASHDSTQGKVFYTCLPSSDQNNWGEQTIRFTAPSSGKYITIKAVSTNKNSGTWLDGFTLRGVLTADNVVKASNTKDIRPATTSMFDATIVYPNPNNGVFSVNTEWSGEMNVTVYNTVGSAVKTFTATKDSMALTSLDLSHEQPGLYFIELATANSKVTKKVVVTR